MVDQRHLVYRFFIGSCMARYHIRLAAVAVCLLGNSLLTGCDAVRLPPSGFATRYVMSWSEERKADPSGTPSEAARYPNQTCRNLAQTRVSDAALSLSFKPDEADSRKMFELTYSDCVKWHGQ
jgi:hypothetical protein